jgi:rare lipoprotein A (peptidoglycan hydrolase)
VILLKTIGTTIVAVGAFLVFTSLCPIYSAELPSTAHGAAQIAAVPPIQIGDASWYGVHHQGRLTASGEPYDPQSLTAAHPTLPLHSTVRVTNLKNGRSVEVRVNDRGPYRGRRVIDLSAKAAETIGLKNRGVARVKVEPLPHHQPAAFHTPAG